MVSCQPRRAGPSSCVVVFTSVVVFSAAVYPRSCVYCVQARGQDLAEMLPARLPALQRRILDLLHAARRRGCLKVQLIAVVLTRHASTLSVRAHPRYRCRRKSVVVQCFCQHGSSMGH